MKTERGVWKMKEDARKGGYMWKGVCVEGVGVRGWKAGQRGRGHDL